MTDIIGKSFIEGFKDVPGVCSRCSGYIILMLFFVRRPLGLSGKLWPILHL